MPDYITIELSKTGKKYAGMYEAIVDAIDADLDTYDWRISIIKTSKYAKRKENIFMHRIILARKLERDELLPTEHVDHIDGNGLNNRRENLRLATSQQNMQNRPKQSNNKSGYKGVKTSGKKWRASITVNRRAIHLGTFDTKEQAYEAYCKKASELFGDFARFD